MKKFLLSLIALAGASIMNAETTVTFDFANEVYGLTRYSNDDKNPAYIDNGTKLTTNGGVEVTLTKTEGKNGWRLWTDGLRAYKTSDAGMTISAPGHKITKISYTLPKTNIITEINGTAVSGKEFSYTTSGAETVTLAYTVSNNGAIVTMAVELDGEGGGNVDPDPDPDPITTVGDGSEANPYTVADVIALNNTKPAAAWVKGYIVGAMNSNAEYTLEVAAPFTVASNVYIAETATETETAKMVPIQLVGGTDIRKAVNLVDNSGNIGKELYIKGSLEAYFQQPGIKAPSAYKLDGQGTTPVDPDPITTEGNGTEEKPYTVADVIALNNTKSEAAWVTGYIVGALATSPNYHKELEAPFTIASNIYIAATPNETDTTKMVPVELKSGTKFRNDLNLMDRPGNLGKEVSIKGELIAYFKQPGVKNLTDYTIVGGLAPLPVSETPSLTSFVEEQSESNLKITGAVTVFYQSPDKKYTFITDGETNLEVYGLLPEYKNGDQLTGIVGKYSFYQNMPQMTPQADSFGEATPGTPVEPKNVAFNQVGICDYVVIDAIEITEADGKFYIGQGDEQRQIFDRFNLGEVKAGVATITGIGAIYGETKQIFPIALDYKSSISEISIEAAAGQVYDLQGRKVAQPVRGLYIVGGQKKFIR